MSPKVRDGQAGPGPQGLFTANFPVGTDTGMLRQNVLRLNYSIHCEELNQTDFPSTCPGNNPFNKTYTNIDVSDPNPFGDQTSRRYRVRICAPGDTTASPWKSTGNRQDISEEFYLDSETTNNSHFIDDLYAMNNFTQHCTTSTSMGYFELPNYYNNHKAGDLLAVLPSAATISSWNDLEFRDANNPQTPGPMMLSVLAIFGDGSFFDRTASQNNYSDNDSILVCEQLRQPFSGIQFTDFPWFTIQPTPQCTPTSINTTGSPYANALVNALFDWLHAFRNASDAESAFNLTIYSAHKSLLTAQATDVDDGNLTSTKPGHDIQKPDIPLPALIVISALLAIQILCLAGLALYASWYHTWTNSFDAFALLRMGASLGQEELPLISNVKASTMFSLDEREGWIGASVPAGQQDDTSPGVLAIGGRHRMERNRLYRNVLNDGGWLYEKAKVPVVVRSLVRFLSPEKQQGDEPKKFVKVGWEYRRVGRTVADV
ncbi:hypothetical protein ABVK25_012054 [Lepraria finkii]|uniref:Uncharacterized protein n=1 Tax=Lepraria finkii TaxID=1340010 RepID=A0ABR4AJ47_9LECA